MLNKALQSKYGNSTQSISPNLKHEISTVAKRKEDLASIGVFSFYTLTYPGDSQRKLEQFRLLIEPKSRVWKISDVKLSSIYSSLVGTNTAVSKISWLRQ